MWICGYVARYTKCLEPGNRLPGTKMNTAGTAVAEREKKAAGKKPAPAKGSEAGKVKYDASVKLTEAFKEQLEVVAAALGMYPGALVEDRIGQFVRTEYRRILSEKLKQIEGD